MLTDDSEQDERMTRALLTNGERDAVLDDPEMDSGTKSSHLSRVRNKIPELQEDADLLRRNRPEIYEQVRDAVVEEEIDDRIQRLEKEVEDLRKQVESAD